ncbi:hypothetical protein [Spiroplasma endosymbiont of Labia minor]|uniref:hypothetical protein n=1 Tax=Spiroplasma endosymbiont of Labia minor TaxID=3066305 RepID=UPI0030D1C703
MAVARYIDFNNEKLVAEWNKYTLNATSKLFSAFSNVSEDGNALPRDNIRIPLMSPFIAQEDYDDAIGIISKHIKEVTITFPVNQRFGGENRLGHYGLKIGWKDAKLFQMQADFSWLIDDYIAAKIVESATKNVDGQIKAPTTWNIDTISELLGELQSVMEDSASRLRPEQCKVIMDYKLIAVLKAKNIISGAKTVEGTALEIYTGFGWQIIPRSLKKLGYYMLITTPTNVVSFRQTFVQPKASTYMEGEFTGQQYVITESKYDAFIVKDSLVYSVPVPKVDPTETIVKANYQRIKNDSSYIKTLAERIHVAESVVEDFYNKIESKKNISISVENNSSKITELITNLQTKITDIEKKIPENRNEDTK